VPGIRPKTEWRRSEGYSEKKTKRKEGNPRTKKNMKAGPVFMGTEEALQVS
jgi:hypothetical protein